MPHGPRPGLLPALLPAMLFFALGARTPEALICVRGPLAPIGALEPQRQEPPQPAFDGVRQVQRLYAQRRYQEAARAAEQLVRERREDPDAWIALASVHLAPDWAFRHDARAESASLRAVKLTARRPDVVALLVTAKHRQAKYDECLPLIGELADAAPPKVAPDVLADLLAMRADIALRRQAEDPGARARAQADLDRAIAAMPSAGSVRTMRAEIAIQDGRYPDALADLEVAVALLPGSKQARYQMQTCLARMGRRDEARRHYEIWRRLNRLTDSHGRTNAPEPAERRQLLRELKELNPADLEHRLALAQIEIELGDFERAIAECDELLALSPGWPAAQHMRGEAARRKAGGAPAAPPAPAPATTPADGGSEGDEAQAGGESP